VLIRRILQFSCRHSLLVLLLTAAVTLGFGFFASRLRVNPDVESLIPENAAMRQLMNRYRQGGQSGEYLVVAVSSPDVFNPAGLAAYGQALARLEELPELGPGITPFNLITFEKKGSRVAAVPVSPERRAPRTAEELEVFRRRLAATPYAANLVVSRDMSVLAAFFPASPTRDFAALMSRVREITAPLNAYYRCYLSGSIPFLERTGVYLSRDLAVLFVVAAAVILLFYFLAFRSVRGVLLPFLVVLMGTVWSLGLMSALGFSLTLLNIVTPPLLLTVGSSYGIHVLNQYYRHAGARGKDWLIGAVEEVSGTILLASLTTVIGFASLLVTDIRQVREFAVVTSFGTAACALLALFFFPAVLSLLPVPGRRQARRARAGLLSGLLLRLSRFVIRRRWPILAVLAACVLGFALGLPFIRADTDTIGYFPRRDRVVQDMYFLTGKLGGFDELNLSLLAPEGEQGYFLRPEVLSRVDALQRRLASIPDICYAVSFASYVRFLNQVASGEDRIPEGRAPILLLSRMVRALAAEASGSNPLAGLANEDFSRLTLSFRIFNSRTGKFINEQGLRDLLAQMKPLIAAGLPEGARSELWGMGLQYLSLSDLLRNNLLRSFGLSALLVLGVAVLSFRSLRQGLLAIVPMVLGIMMNFLLMAVARIPLDMTTIMVSSVAVGMGVDNAIHFFLAYRRRRARVPGDHRRAVAVTLVLTGRPIFLTTLSIAAGLLVLVLASFRPIAYFGVLVVFALAATCASTLIALPALLALLPGRDRSTALPLSRTRPGKRP
jgi:predicted RND superfamily exporter protein